jgi:glycosyltransferase involved in cell wall biosynthesis
LQDDGAIGDAEARPAQGPAGLHVGLNLLYLVPGETGGTETVARELLPELVAAAPQIRFTAFLNREAASTRGGPWKELMPWIEVPVRATRRAEWVRGEQALLPRLAKRADVDLVHSLANTAPLHGRFVRVVTIHDLIHRLHPEAHEGVTARVFGALVHLAAARSQRIQTVSHASARDLVRLLGVPERKIDVVPNGAGFCARPGPLPGAVLRERFGLGERRVVLTVSARRPHKNIARLLEALALIPAEQRPLLVQPGYPSPYDAGLAARAHALGCADDFRLLGWIAAEELEGLYRLAACCVFPSLYEGFGLPVLEAMSRGVPVACSGRGALREVAGDAAELFDPERPVSIANALETLLGDAERAGQLQAAGRARATRYTWAAAATAALASYAAAMRGTASGT